MSDGGGWNTIEYQLLKEEYWRDLKLPLMSDVKETEEGNVIVESIVGEGLKNTHYPLIKQFEGVGDVGFV